MKIVPVVSGKGGVGKSTVAVNLAVALARIGKRVALIDADMYGPSVPTLMGGGSLQADHEGRIIPAEKYGVKYVSLGFFLTNPDDPVIWRGPMFTKALNQLFHDVNWGASEIIIVDMPPGTGDAQISISQLVKLMGAVVVTTPQEVALADVRKSVNMLKKVNVPVLGIVENMSGYKMPNGEITELFGKGGGKDLAEKLGVPLLAEIPLDISLRIGGDQGQPAAAADNDASLNFKNMALKLNSILDTLPTASEVKIVD